MIGVRSFFSSRIVVVVCWVLVWLTVIDLGVNLAFGRRAAATSSLGRYFEYGRSVEGKLARTVAGDPKKEGALVGAGWIVPEAFQNLPNRAREADGLLLAVYGQSFAMNAATEAARMDPRITVRAVGGPAAPPSHSYAAYKEDVAHRKADIVVFGILSASVPHMGSLSGLVWQFENPAPYTFPRYRLYGGQITEELPVIRSEAEFRKAFTSQSADWRRFKDQLKRSDRGFDGLTFDRSFTDASATVRLLRRGWVAHRHAYEEGVYDPSVGFNPDSEEIKVLQAMLLDLQRLTRARGERLVVLLMHTRGQSNHLHMALRDTLRQARIEYISTDSLFTANDPTNFLPDSHYTPPANHKLAAALLTAIGRASGATTTPPGAAGQPALGPR